MPAEHHSPQSSLLWASLTVDGSMLVSITALAKMFESQNDHQRRLQLCSAKMAVDLGNGRIIPFPPKTYEVKKLLGCGTFGVVVECGKAKTKGTVALKVIKSTEAMRAGLLEADTLRMLSKLKAESFNIVRMNNAFSFQGHFFLEFEKLDVDLRKFMHMQSTGALGLKLIRPILQQVATALDFLKRVGVTHADLKPENIMLVDHIREPLRVKVIDFGLSLQNPKDCTGAPLQTLWYRSPEVLVGAPFDEAIDVWSLGCIAAQMLMGQPLFSASTEYEAMKQIVCTIGKPSEELLDAGLFTDNLFWPKDKTGHGGRTFKLMTTDWVLYTLPHRSLNLWEIIMLYHQVLGQPGYVAQNDVANFISLVMQMLRVDPQERISPAEILEHPFITLSHLRVAFYDHPYTTSSCKAMHVCRVQRNTAVSHAGSDDAF